MSEELKGKSKSEKVIFDTTKKVYPVPNYKHHKVGDFTCESEVEQDGKILCCLHNPVTGAWKYVHRGDN